MSQHGTLTELNAERLWSCPPSSTPAMPKPRPCSFTLTRNYRCYMVECLQMFTALKMHGVESRVALFKGENHELSRSGRPRARIRRMEEIVDWMNGHLKG